MISLAAPVGNAALPATVAAALKRAAIPTTAVGIQVQEIASGRTLLALNPAQPLNPASTMKLITTDAALELLGPTYTFTTQVWTRGQRVGDQINGDLIVRGSGDPKLVLENFWLLLRKIRAAGIRSVHGDLLLDRSVFANAVNDPAQFDGDPLKPYNAAPDALLLNYHALAVHLAPDSAHGSVQITADPMLYRYPIKAPALAPGPCVGDWRQPITAQFGSSGASFDGAFAAGCGDKTWEIHPYQLSRNRYFELVFRQLWSELGGTLDGAVTDGVAGSDASLLTQWDSPTVPELIRDTNKFSNNVMARQLFLALGGTAQPASVAASRAAVEKWLAEKGIDSSGLVLENGAGLSRIERVPAALLSQLLVNAFAAPTMPELISSLPLVGYDGTMQKRLRGQGVAGRAHIKSGSLQEVRSIAGYVLAASGKRYAVVFIINHPNAARGAEAQDALLQWIYDGAAEH